MERRKGPPPIESILGLPNPPADPMLDNYGLMTFGPRGAWHRLWGLLANRAAFENASGDDGIAEAIAKVRAEVETMIGRPITHAEMAALDADAAKLGREVIGPMMRQED
jgi:hypothetical protein